MPEFEQSNSPKKLNRHHRLAGLGLFSLILFLGWMRWTQILNGEERRIVGRWMNESKYDNGDKSKSILDFADDRTMKIHNTFIVVETENEESRPHITLAEATWRVKNGKIVITPIRSSGTRLRLCFLKLASTVSGRKFVDGALTEGRVKFPERDEMVIQLYDPLTRKYQNINNRMFRDWTREE